MKATMIKIIKLFQSWLGYAVKNFQTMQGILSKEFGHIDVLEFSADHSSYI